MEREPFRNRTVGIVALGVVSSLIGAAIWTVAQSGWPKAPVSFTVPDRLADPLSRLLGYVNLAFEDAFSGRANVSDEESRDGASVLSPRKMVVGRTIVFAFGLYFVLFWMLLSLIRLLWENSWVELAVVGLLGLPIISLGVPICIASGKILFLTAFPQLNKAWGFWIGFGVGTAELILGLTITAAYVWAVFRVFLND
jgi:hypothetical protein